MARKLEYLDGLTGHVLAVIPEDAIPACSHMGACDADVAYWAPQCDFPASMDEMRASLRETGAWTAEELAGEADEIIRERIVWLGCCDLRENGALDQDGEDQ